MGAAKSRLAAAVKAAKKRKSSVGSFGQTAVQRKAGVAKSRVAAAVKARAATRPRQTATQRKAAAAKLTAKAISIIENRKTSAKERSRAIRTLSTSGTNGKLKRAAQAHVKQENKYRALAAARKPTAAQSAAWKKAAKDDAVRRKTVAGRKSTARQAAAYRARQRKLWGISSSNASNYRKKGPVVSKMIQALLDRGRTS